MDKLEALMQLKTKTQDACKDGYYEELSIDLYQGGGILILTHSSQCNQHKAGRRNSLVPFRTKKY